MKQVKIELTSETAKMPKKGSTNAAGYDLYVDLFYTKFNLRYELHNSTRYKVPYIKIQPNSTMLFLTGFKMQLPANYEAQVRTRSGMALKSQVVVTNAPGTIDEDYRGEVGVILTNLSNEPYNVGHGDRIAQMVIKEVPEVELIEDKVNDTIRGEGGFGSTGK